MIKGLHRNDFIMAAKTDELYGSRAELLLFHPSSR
jgi:pterin-4a-carbinolamine dehydratase